MKREIGDWRLETNSQSPISSLPSLTLVTGTLFAPILTRTAAEFVALTGLQLTVRPIVNKRLGTTITVAGLLMGADVLRPLQTGSPGDLVILPRIMFDHPDTITLDDLSPQQMADQLGCIVALADTMGDVWDAVTGESRLIFKP